MTVRKTESRIPEGFTVNDLGQAVVSDDGNYALVSYLTSPIAQNTPVNYVVFAFNNDAESYYWTFESIPSGIIEKKDPIPDGIYKYTPKHLGTLKVKVEVQAPSGNALLELDQDIVPLDSFLESLLAGRGSMKIFGDDVSKGALGGTDITSRELVNNFRNYILETAYQYKNFILAESSETYKIPPRFLAAIAYLAISRSELNNISREDYLEKAAEGLNNESPNSFLFDSLGVCQIKPHMLAMAIRKSKSESTSESTYTEWIEIPADGSMELEIQETIKKNFFYDLYLNDKIDIFNLLRFPKSNIRMCEQLLHKLNIRSHRWGNLNGEQLLNNEVALATIATEFFDGPTLAIKPTDPPSDEQIKSSPSGKKVVSIINTPFLSSITYGTYELKGKVIDSSGKGIADAEVRLYRTMVRTTIDDYEFFDDYNNLIKKIPKDDYSVLELKIFTPTIDTYDVKIKIGNVEGWIRSKKWTKHGAFIFDERIPHTKKITKFDGSFNFNVYEEQLYRIRSIKKDYFDGESERVHPVEGDISIEMEQSPNNINELYLIELLHKFKDFGYYNVKDDKGNVDVRYPYNLPNVGVPQAPPKRNNCSTFCEAIIVKAWKNALKDSFTWSLLRHQQMMIASKDDYFSPVTATTESEMAIEIDANELPPPWTIVQGWKSQWEGGHTFLIVDVNQDTEQILTLESNAKNYAGTEDFYKLKGPGCREIGNIDSLTDYKPDKIWWKDVTTWNWTKYKEIYKHRKMAHLKVYDLKWVK